MEVAKGSQRLTKGLIIATMLAVVFAWLSWESKNASLEREGNLFLENLILKSELVECKKVVSEYKF